MPWYQQHRACLDQADLAELSIGDNLSAERIAAFDAWAHACGRGSDPARVVALLEEREMLLWSATEDPPEDFVDMLQSSWGGADLTPPWPVLDGASSLDLGFCRTVRRNAGDAEAVARAMRTFTIDPLAWARAIIDRSQVYLYPVLAAFAAAVHQRRSPDDVARSGVRTDTVMPGWSSAPAIGAAAAAAAAGAYMNWGARSRASGN